MNSQSRKAYHRNAKDKPKKSLEDEVRSNKRWTDDEISTLLHCLKTYGHKNITEICKFLPRRTPDEIQSFVRTASSSARKRGPTYPVIDAWITACISETNKFGECKYGDTLQIAQIVKYLSIDGLLENHPLPERCEGIDFPAAYRLLYQALMGYPMQPVNEKTAEFICETMSELNYLVSGDKSVTSTVQSFLKKKFEVPNCETMQSNFENTVKESVADEILPLTVKKPVRVYQRKKPEAPNSVEIEVPKIILTLTEEGKVESGASINYSIKVQGSDITSIVTVPVPQENEKRNNEEHKTQMFQSVGYNPLQVPEKWLREPFELNASNKSVKELQASKRSLKKKTNTSLY